MEKRYKKSSTWKYFNQQTANRAKCKLCNKIISCTNTTNMKSHLKFNHHSTFIALNNRQSQRFSDDENEGIACIDVIDDEHDETMETMDDNSTLSQRGS